MLDGAFCTFGVSAFGLQSGGVNRTAAGAILEAWQRLGFHISLRIEVADPRWAYASHMSQQFLPWKAPVRCEISRAV